MRGGINGPDREPVKIGALTAPREDGEILTMASLGTMQGKGGSLP